MHFSALKSWLEIANGTLIYNLELLIREGRVRSERDGFFKRYYPVKTELHLTPVPMMNMEDRIKVILRDNPGAAQSELAHNLDESRQTVHYNVKKLVGMGILEPEPNRDGHPRYRLARSRAARRMLKDIFERRLELPDTDDEPVETF